MEQIQQIRFCLMSVHVSLSDVFNLIPFSRFDELFVHCIGLQHAVNVGMRDFCLCCELSFAIN